MRCSTTWGAWKTWERAAGIRIFKEVSELDEEEKKIREKKMREFAEKSSAPSEPLVLGDSEFDETVKKYPLMVVDFWSENCPPCRLIAPVLHELAGEMKGRVVFGKVCVDEHRQKAMQFGVSAIPTLLVFRKGELVDRIIGFSGKEDLVSRLSKHLGE